MFYSYDVKLLQYLFVLRKVVEQSTVLGKLFLLWAVILIFTDTRYHKDSSCNPATVSSYVFNSYNCCN